MPHGNTAASVRQGIPPGERAKLSALLARAESGQGNFEAERLAALAAVERLLRQRDLRLRDLAALAPEPHREPLQGSWRTVCAALAERQGSLRPWERGFVADLSRFLRLSSKQRYILNEIADRVLGKDRPR